MIELRWLVKQSRHPAALSDDPDVMMFTKVLQYRTIRTVSMPNEDTKQYTFTTVWSDWQDVPEATDD